MCHLPTTAALPREFKPPVTISSTSSIGRTARRKSGFKSSLDKSVFVEKCDLCHKLNQKTDLKKRKKKWQARLYLYDHEVFCQIWVFKHHTWGYSSVLALTPVYPVHLCSPHVLLAGACCSSMWRLNKCPSLMFHMTHKKHFFKYNTIKLQSNESLQEAPGC